MVLVAMVAEGEDTEGRKQVGIEGRMRKQHRMTTSVDHICGPVGSVRSAGSVR